MAIEECASLNLLPDGKGKKNRRIIKAAVPQKAAAGTVTVDSKATEKETQDPTTKHRSTQMHESRSITREAIKEHADSSVRMSSQAESAMKLQSSKREKKLQQRRLNPKPQTPTPKANPFSRFISAFSVLPKFPEHKRPFQSSPADKEELMQPEGKRLRASNSTVSDTEEPKSKETMTKTDSSHHPVPSITFVASAVTVAVVAILLTLRWRRNN
jgi:hypothetical protein